MTDTTTSAPATRTTRTFRPTLIPAGVTLVAANLAQFADTSEAEHVRFALRPRLPLLWSPCTSVNAARRGAALGAVINLAARIRLALVPPGHTAALSQPTTLPADTTPAGPC